MNPDRHIYLTTAVLAIVFATAINVLMPAERLAGTTMHRETAASGRTARAAPATAESSPTPRASPRERVSL